FRVGIPLPRNIPGTVFVGGERKVIVDKEVPNSTIVTNGEEFYKAFVGYSVTWNNLDDTKKPTEGLYASFSQQYIGWDHSLVKTEARARYFVPVIEDSGIVASLRGQAGIVNDLSGNGVHSVEAFIPGSQLIRAFEGCSAGPRLSTGAYLGG